VTVADLVCTQRMCLQAPAPHNATLTQLSGSGERLFWCSEISERNYAIMQRGRSWPGVYVEVLLAAQVVHLGPLRVHWIRLQDVP
jgi:hypothetical protein